MAKAHFKAYEAHAADSASIKKTGRTVTGNALSESDRDKAAHRLSRHAMELSKSSDDYEGALQSHAEKAVKASKSREHDDAAKHHLRASGVHLDCAEDCTMNSELIDNDDEQGDERGTHIVAAKAHQLAATSHYDVARSKREGNASAEDDSFGDEPVDEDELLENSYGEYKTSTGECKMKTEAANSHSDLAEKTERELDHARASRLHNEAASAWMSHEDGPETDKAAKHSKRADDHAQKAGPGFLMHNSNQDGQRGSSDDVSNQEGANMAKLTANQRAACIDQLTSNNGCGCWKPEDKEILQGFSDERLGELKTNHESHLATNSSTKEETPMTDDEWMKAAPPGIRAIVTNGADLMRSEKSRIIGELTANMKDGAEKTAHVTKLEAKSLDEVRELRDSIKMFAAPAPVENQRRTVYGPTGTPQVVDNSADEPNDEDPSAMVPGRIDWVDLANKRGAPVFGKN